MRIHTLLLLALPSLVACGQLAEMAKSATGEGEEKKETTTHIGEPEGSTSAPAEAATAPDATAAEPAPVADPAPAAPAEEATAALSPAPLGVLLFASGPKGCDMSLRDLKTGVTEPIVTLPGACGGDVATSIRADGQQALIQVAGANTYEVDLVKRSSKKLPSPPAGAPVLVAYNDSGEVLALVEDAAAVPAKKGVDYKGKHYELAAGSSPTATSHLGHLFSRSSGGAWEEIFTDLVTVEKGAFASDVRLGLALDQGVANWQNGEIAQGAYADLTEAILSTAPDPSPLSAGARWVSLSSGDVKVALARLSAGGWAAPVLVGSGGGALKPLPQLSGAVEAVELRGDLLLLGVGSGDRLYKVSTAEEVLRATHAVFWPDVPLPGTPDGVAGTTVVTESEARDRSGRTASQRARDRHEARARALRLKRERAQ